GSVVTETVTNHLPASGYVFSLRRGEKGFVPPAEKKVGPAVSRSLTLVRTTYRPLTEVTDAVTGTPDVGTNQFVFTPCRCGEVGANARAFPGGRLEAKPVEGDANGQVLVRCASRVTGDADKGYEYTDTVENLSGKPLHFKWAGGEGSVEPGKTYTKTERSGKL